jgi:DNA-binding transcriptional regulator YiaG
MNKPVRGYDSLFIQRVKSADLDKEVKALALACINHAVSVSQAASLLKVTRGTMYNWMTGRTKPYPKHLAAMPKVTAQIKRL